MDPKVERFIQDLPEDKRALALRLRELVLSAAPGITEALKWGQLVFVAGKKNIAYVNRPSAKADYLNLGFMDAVALSDPKNLFEGTGSRMRHIKLTTEKDIPVAQVKKWVKEAVAL